jgi:outer membrane lipoprotein SlyB
MRISSKTLLKTLPLSMASVLVLSACTTLNAPYFPVVDEAPSAKLNSDIQACQALASNHVNRDENPNDDIATGALVGAAAGGIEDAWDGAIVGALLGGAIGALTGNSEKNSRTNYDRKDITRNCMIGRGHNVIG